MQRTEQPENPDHITKSQRFPDFQIIPPNRRTEELISCLTEVWESSVRSTHLFLSEEEIQRISGFVPYALREIPCLIVLRDEEEFTGFMGIDSNKLEMLFLAPKQMGKGVGSRLLQYGITDFGVREVCVNEQNPAAKEFYEFMGFTVYKRTERDEQGGPYPLLYMKLD